MAASVRHMFCKHVLKCQRKHVLRQFSSKSNVLGSAQHATEDSENKQTHFGFESIPEDEKEERGTGDMNDVI
jgi:hypothetical protein